MTVATFRSRTGLGHRRVTAPGPDEEGATAPRHRRRPLDRATRASRASRATRASTGPTTRPRPAAPTPWHPRDMAADGVALAVLTLAVIAFTGGWLGGRLVLDGPGASLWVDLVQNHLDAGGFSYWTPEVWAGNPTWALAPSLPVFVLAPLASLVGAEAAVRLASVAGQVVGAWGAYVLARSLWSHRVPSLVAGLLYALHPVIIAHSALAGHQPAVAVMGLTPWMVWSLRRALRGDGAQYIGAAGLIMGLAILFQPEHAYGLALLAGAVFAVEVAQARFRDGARNWRAVLLRTGVVGAIALGMLAAWLLPFVALGENFVLTPESIVRSTLVEGIGGAVGRDPGLILGRAESLDGVTSFQNTDFLEAGGFYVSWVSLVLTLATVAVLRRKDRDGHLTAILFACALAVWLQTGGIPLAESGLVRSTSVLAFVAIGAVAGLLVGSFLQQLRFGRWAAVAGVATAAFLVSLPYVAPFLTLQRFVPLLSTVRFPRLFPIVPLGLALGSAYVVVLARDWVKNRRPELVAPATAILALVALGAFLVDIHPYRSFYRVYPPQSVSSYGRAAAVMDASGTAYRAAGSLDPRGTEPILDTGRRVSTGWPHPLASHRVWRLTAEAMFVSPPGFRDAALALSGTSHVVNERMANPVEVPGPLIDGVDLEPNPLVLPIVRAYDQVVVVRDDAITPELATSLAQRHVGVVTGGPAETEQLGEAAAGVVGAANPCSEPTVGVSGFELALAGDVAAACALHRWIGVFIRNDFLETDREGAGAIVRPGADGLRGIGVWIDRPPGPAELIVYELGPDQRTLGRELRRTVASGYDVNGISAFTFDPITDSGGGQYVFVLECPSCPDGESPRVVIAGDDRAPGDLVVEGRVDTSSVVAYSLDFDGIDGAEPSSTRLSARNPRPGEWRIATSGERSSLVVVSEAWFPGWSARVDGRSVPVLLADGAFVGVAVGPGEHQIELSYGPPAVATAARATSGLATVGGLALVAAGLRRRRGRLASAVGGAAAVDGAADGTSGGAPVNGSGPWRQGWAAALSEWPAWLPPVPWGRPATHPPDRSRNVHPGPRPGTPRRGPGGRSPKARGLPSLRSRRPDPPR